MVLVDQEIVRGLNENHVRLQDVLRKVAKIGCDDDISPFVNSGGDHMLVMRIGNVRYSIEQIRGNGNRKPPEMLRACSGGDVSPAPPYSQTSVGFYLLLPESLHSTMHERVLVPPRNAEACRRGALGQGRKRPAPLNTRYRVLGSSRGTRSYSPSSISVRAKSSRVLRRAESRLPLKARMSRAYRRRCVPTMWKGIWFCSRS